MNMRKVPKSWIDIYMEGCLGIHVQLHKVSIFQYSFHDLFTPSLSILHEDYRGFLKFWNTDGMTQ